MFVMLRYFYGALDLPQETNESRQDFFRAALNLKQQIIFVSNAILSSMSLL